MAFLHPARAMRRWSWSNRQAKILPCTFLTGRAAACITPATKWRSGAGLSDFRSRGADRQASQTSGAFQGRRIAWVLTAEKFLMELLEEGARTAKYVAWVVIDSPMDSLCSRFDEVRRRFIAGSRYCSPGTFQHVAAPEIPAPAVSPDVRVHKSTWSGIRWSIAYFSSSLSSAAVASPSAKVFACGTCRVVGQTRIYIGEGVNFFGQSGYAAGAIRRPQADHWEPRRYRPQRDFHRE